MNIDFHYFGTYVAARLAGYDLDQAQTIAYAAQYVDDSDMSMLKDPLGRYYIEEFTPIPTVQGMSEMLADNINWSEDASNRIADVWVPFHFLPGNYGGMPNIKTYTGPTYDKGYFYRWLFDEESAKQFKMLCQPNSLTVKLMIKDIIDDHCNQDYALVLAGLRMHVLADTWAHMFYIGMPTWFINDADEAVDIVGATSKTPYGWKRVWPWDDSTDIVHGDVATPGIGAYNSVYYLGHGRMGHLPDYPWLTYEYRPRWSKAPVVKDNTDYFLKAIKQMTKALSCIKNNTPFNVDEYADLPQEAEEIIRAILSTEPQGNDQSEVWKANIGNIKINGIYLEVPKDYDKGLWLENYKTAKDRKKTNYYRFNDSACRHLTFVRNSLAAYNINFDAILRENIVKTKFKCKEGKYIGNIVKSNQYYPKMQDKGVVLQIIKQTPALLSSGDIIEIRTLEPLAGEYNFLGAWETPALYYYTRDYDISKQKWQIIKVDASGSNKIREGDQVRFRNMNFDKKPYLCTYGFFGTSYLTTQADGTADNAVWIMEDMTEFDIDIITPDYFQSNVIDSDLSKKIHGDINAYGIINAENVVDKKKLKVALDGIGLGFINTDLDKDQKEQVHVDLQKIVNNI